MPVDNQSRAPGSAAPAAAQKGPPQATPGRQTIANATAKSKGGKMPGGLQAGIEKSMGGEDLGDVEVHTDGAAAEAAGGLGAKAFTVGQAIYFGEGQYNPGSKEGDHLIAHEAAHTVQQKGAAAPSGEAQLAALEVSSPGDKHESEAESFADAFSKGGTAKVSGVSKGSIARAVIQRDLLDGKPPAALEAQPAPIHASEPQTSDLTHGAADAIKQARAAGGTSAVVAKVHELRNGSTPKTAGAVETAISSTLTEDEKNALDGKTSKQPAATPEQGGHKDTAPTNKAADKKVGGADGGADPATENKGDGAKTTGGDKDGKADADGKKTAAPGGKTEGGPAPGAAPAKEGNTEGGTETAHHVPEAAGKELIEQELSFHEKWAAYSEKGAAGRAAMLGKGLGGDLLGGGAGALTQVLLGQGTKLAVTKTALGKIPGAGNIIGGAFSAYALFSHGGAGAKEMVGEIKEGIGGAFSAQNWKESPWLTAANLVAGIKAILELVGNICQILSGLAYAFAAIAALGGLLSIFFPPLAILLPYIPTAINFGRACGGIATVCLSIASMISPIPPILRAIHLIFSNQDPVKLVAQDKKFHQEAQGAIANYGAATANSAIDGKGFNPIKAMNNERKEGMETTESAMHKGAVENTGEGMGSPELDLKGAREKALSGGVKENLPGKHAGKTDEAVKAGKNHFNPDDAARTTKNKGDVDSAEDRLKTVEATEKNREAQLKAAEAKAEADPSRANRRALKTAEGRVDKAHDKVEAAEENLGEAEARKEVGGRNNHGGAQGNAGDTGNSARNRLGENLEEPKIETAGEAYKELRQGAEPVEPTKNAKGNVELPEPPGNLQEIESLDQQIESMKKQEEELKKTASEAKQTATQAKTVQTGLTQSAAGVQQKVSSEQQRSQQEQQKITAQTADMQAKTQQAQGQTASGAQKGAGALGGIASAARTVDGFAQKVPSNKFFDVSGTKNNIHQFVVGMDQITGAPGQAQQSQAQTSAATQQRGQQQQEAAQANAAGVQSGQQLHSKMTQDASTAATSSAQATEVAATSTQKGNEVGSNVQQMTQKREQKWNALLAWAARHRAIREAATAE